jgi:hypothetical protein
VSRRSLSCLVALAVGAGALLPAGEACAAWVNRNTVAPRPPAVAGGAPTSVTVPPIVLQQIPTASVPMQPPPPAAPAAAVAASSALSVEGSGSSTPDGISSLVDLDRGAALWSYINPDFDPSLGTDPYTRIDPVVGTAHAEPLPEVTEVPLADNLAIEVRKPLRHRTVPGIDPVTSGSGNRNLWFEDRR